MHLSAVRIDGLILEAIVIFALLNLVVFMLQPFINYHQPSLIKPRVEYPVIAIITGTYQHHIDAHSIKTPSQNEGNNGSNSTLFQNEGNSSTNSTEFLHQIQLKSSQLLVTSLESPSDNELVKM